MDEFYEYLEEQGVEVRVDAEDEDALKEDLTDEDNLRFKCSIWDKNE